MLFGISKFDACWKRDKTGALTQAYADIPSSKRDCIQLKRCLQKYEIMFEDIYDLSDDPTPEETETVLATISKKVREGKNKCIPIENYLIICLFAGHGVLKDGMQTMMYNVYDRKNGFYKFMNAEKKMRGWAQIYPNAYIIGIFACCR